MIKPNFKSFKLVFSKPWYIFLAVFTSLFFLAMAVFIPSYPLIKFFWQADWIKINLFSLAIKHFMANSSEESYFLAISLAILTGINSAMFAFYIKRRINMDKSVGTGLFGMILGLLGVGCASCGSIILSSIFGFTATASFLGVLPLRGVEFGILGIALLLLSIYLLSIKIPNPLLCKIDNKKASSNN